MKAEGKFVESFTKAEAKGGCVTTADAAAIEVIVDDTLDELLAALPSAAPPSCPVAGDDTACTAFAVPDSACEDCCFAVGAACTVDCLAASGATCTGDLLLDACSTAINAGGCAEECCP